MTPSRELLSLRCRLDAYTASIAVSPALRTARRQLSYYMLLLAADPWDAALRYLVKREADVVLALSRVG